MFIKSRQEKYFHHMPIKTKPTIFKDFIAWSRGSLVSVTYKPLWVYLGYIFAATHSLFNVKVGLMTSTCNTSPGSITAVIALKHSKASIWALQFSKQFCSSVTCFESVSCITVYLSQRKEMTGLYLKLRLYHQDHLHILFFNLCK